MNSTTENTNSWELAAVLGLVGLGLTALVMKFIRDSNSNGTVTDTTGAIIQDSQDVARRIYAAGHTGLGGAFEDEDRLLSIATEIVDFEKVATEYRVLYGVNLKDELVKWLEGDYNKFFDTINARKLNTSGNTTTPTGSTGSTTPSNNTTGFTPSAEETAQAKKLYDAGHYSLWGLQEDEAELLRIATEIKSYNNVYKAYFLLYKEDLTASLKKWLNDSEFLNFFRSIQGEPIGASTPTPTPIPTPVTPSASSYRGKQAYATVNLNVRTLSGVVLGSLPSGTYLGKSAGTVKTLVVNGKTLPFHVFEGNPYSGPTRNSGQVMVWDSGTSIQWKI